MRYFRIKIYLPIVQFFISLLPFPININYQNEIKKILLSNSKKNKLFLTNQCRVSFILVLNYLKNKYKDKKEIIFSPYNLPEMINVAKNLNFKIIYCDLDYNTGFFNLKTLKKKINKNTSAVVLTNMFNSYQQSINLRRICNKRKIILIEDNAIYFDNYSILGKNKFFSGTLGDFTIYSFSIMKNICAIYAGAVTTNIKDFNLNAKKQIDNFANFPRIIFLRRTLIFFILKIMSINFLYKNCFFNIIKYAHINKIKSLIFVLYPGMRFKIKTNPSFYFTKIPNISKKLIYFQLKNKEKRLKNHNERKLKNIYYYNKLSKLKLKDIKIFKISDFNYQNFIDFPLLVKKREKLNYFLLNNGIEARLFYYRNCEKIFRTKGKTNCKNSEKYEKQILCLPNHEKITFEYIDYIVEMIKNFHHSKN